MIVCGGEFAFVYQHPAKVYEVREEVGALMATHIKTSMTTLVKRESEEFWKDITREMNISFMTDFWTRLMSKGFMTLSMHWITRDWSLRMHVLGTISFLERPHSCKHFRYAHRFPFGDCCVSQESQWQDSLMIRCGEVR